MERLRLPIVYYSLTGNVRRFVEKTGRRAYQIPEIVAEPYILVTPTIGFGEIPEPVTEYLREYGGWLRAVAVSGNRNFGPLFGVAGEKIAREYGVPLILRFELAGNDEDVRKFNEEVSRIDEEVTR
nr:class Ib ribonucleoside-diphosphate reductase assembly flavoprotein NrdI [Paenibacillus cisolokensis]